jgi:two-component system, OmpR family, phosphate regulon sensor histidine kinase PhoR
MDSLRLHFQGDAAAAQRLREVLAREGFRVTEADGADLVVQADGAAEMAARVEELERSVLELRNLDVAKSQFLTNVSHELRTPLTAIVTYGEILRDGLLGEISPRQREAIESMIGSCRQLLAMIEEILTYARSTASAIDIRPGEFRLPEMLVEVRRMNESLLDRKGLAFSADLPADLPAAWADRDKVAHVLRNLVGNAIKFTPERGHVTVGCQLLSGSVVLTVSDDGPGIPAAEQERVFDRLYRGQSSVSAHKPGVGLGLSIVKAIVEAHRGSVTLTSSPSGTTALLQLPR